MRPRLVAPRGVEASVRGASLAPPAYRITWLPDARASRLGEWLPWTLAGLAALLLMFATLLWPWWSGAVGHSIADYRYWQGREAARNGEAQIVVQRYWQRAIAADPRYNRVRLDLARSYIDGQWYGGAIAQAQAVLRNRHNRADASLAYTYLGYCDYLLGQQTSGQSELELAVQFDPQNALAQSVLERLQRQGRLPNLSPSASP